MSRHFPSIQRTLKFQIHAVVSNAAAVFLSSAHMRQCPVPYRKTNAVHFEVHCNGPTQKLKKSAMAMNFEKIKSNTP